MWRRYLLALLLVLGCIISCCGSPLWRCVLLVVFAVATGSESAPSVSFVLWRNKHTITGAILYVLLDIASELVRRHYGSELAGL